MVTVVKKVKSIKSDVAIQEFIALRSSRPVIDVRAPSEFQAGHIQSAINIPVLDDMQREAIGTVYSKQGRQQAVIRGLEAVGPKMGEMAKTVIAEVSKNDAPSLEALIYCARGGMRSSSFSWLLEQLGIKAIRLSDGYKSYRQYAQSFFEKPWKLTVLTGLTGAGKTVQLKRLADLGEQVIDLEGLACHRGSAFGGIGQGVQPRTAQFENLIFEELFNFDPSRRVWIEDESRSIGHCMIPASFFQRLHSSPAIFLDIDKSQRARKLAVEYGDLPIDEMKKAIDRIGKRLGGQNVKMAVRALDQGSLESCAEVLLEYYDSTYTHSHINNPRQTTMNVDLNNIDESTTTGKILELANQMDLGLC